MAPGHVNLTVPHEWVEAGIEVFKLSGCMPWIVFEVRRCLFQKLDGIRELHRWDFGQCRVTRPVNKAGKWKDIAGATALMIKPERVGARHRSGGPFVYKERKRRAQSRD